MKHEHNSYILRLAGNLILLVFLVAKFAVVWFYYYVPILEERNRNFYFWGNWAVIGVYLLFLIFFTKNFDGYKVDVLRVRNLCFSNILSVFGTNVAGNMLVWLLARQYTSISPMVVLTLVQWTFIVIWSIILRCIYIRIRQPIRTLVLYERYLPYTFLQKEGTMKEKYEICNYININKEENELFKAILCCDTVLFYDIPAQTRNAYLKYCYEHRKGIIITPKISDIIISGAETLHITDKPLLMIESRSLKVDQLIMKRTFDIILSTVAIVISFPFMLLFAIIIKCYDGGKVFYVQERLTKDEKKFNIIKFRTMSEDSEKNGARLAKKDDDRITPIGRFLRSTHLDELPQMINILKGEMSLVGPRPERQEIVEKYVEHIPEFKYRLEVKAGLTGYAQIYGKYNTTPYDKLRLDLMYIENYSLALDFKLMLLTFKIMFQKGNTEGVQENQQTAIEEIEFNNTAIEYESEGREREV